MLLVPSIPVYDFFYSNVTATRPAAAMGITITPAQNSKGSWSEYVDGALVTQDIYGIAINFNSNAVSTANRNTLVDIGIDPAAGTSYTVIINNLLATSAAPIGTAYGGVWYYFPLFIPAGSSIAARASVDNVTVGSFRSFIQLYGKPRYPAATRVGKYVLTIGAVTGTSEGTVVTCGTTSEGSWTSIGSLSRDAWWYQLGIGTSDASLAAGILNWDLSVGDATNKAIVGGEPFATSVVVGTTEQFSVRNEQFAGGSEKGVNGQNVYVRGQHSGTADSDMTVIVYAVGG